MNEYPIIDAFYLDEKDEPEIKPFVYYNNTFIQECSDLLSDRIQQVFDGLKLVVEPEHKLTLDGAIAQIMLSNDRTIDQIFKMMTGETQMDQNEEKIDHAEMVALLVKPGVDIVASLTPETADMLHMAVGVSGEAGELLDAVKKAAIYCKPIDRENVIEELGDLEFYMEGLRQNLSITREETLDANIEKLGQRYKKFKYTDQAAQDRADKV